MIPKFRLTLIILTAEVILLIAEAVRIDVVAIFFVLALGDTGILTPQDVLFGFASHILITMMSMMILGKGIGKTVL